MIVVASIAVIVALAALSIWRRSVAASVALAAVALGLAAGNVAAGNWLMVSVDVVATALWLNVARTNFRTRTPEVKP